MLCSKNFSSYSNMFKAAILCSPFLLSTQSTMAMIEEPDGIRHNVQQNSKPKYLTEWEGLIKGLQEFSRQSRDKLRNAIERNLDNIEISLQKSKYDKKLNHERKIWEGRKQYFLVTVLWDPKISLDEAKNKLFEYEGVFLRNENLPEFEWFIKDHPELKYLVNEKEGKNKPTKMKELMAQSHAQDEKFPQTLTAENNLHTQEKKDEKEENLNKNQVSADISESKYKAHSHTLHSTQNYPQKTTLIDSDNSTPVAQSTKSKKEQGPSKAEQTEATQFSQGPAYAPFAYIDMMSEVDEDLLKALETEEKHSASKAKSVKADPQPSKSPGQVTHKKPETLDPEVIEDFENTLNILQNNGQNINIILDEVQALNVKEGVKKFIRELINDRNQALKKYPALETIYNEKIKLQKAMKENDKSSKEKKETKSWASYKEELAFSQQAESKRTKITKELQNLSTRKNDEEARLTQIMSYLHSYTTDKNISRDKAERKFSSSKNRDTILSLIDSRDEERKLISRLDAEIDQLNRDLAK